jgi:hypothetical protein
MLQTLDVLIGFILVMLVMSMAVTMVTQFLGTWLLNLKGVALREGLTRLLANLDRGLSATDARKVADQILRDPLVGQPRLFGSSHSLGTVVHREELVKLLLDFASAGDATKVADQMNEPCPHEEKEQLQHRMRKSLAKNGIEDPGEVLAAIRTATLEIEKTCPELSTSVRAAAAILNHAASDFLAKLNNWFDQTIDRVSEIFTARIRIVTFAVSLAVALFFQLNAFQLINRLSVDDELRKEMVKIAIARVQKGSLPAASGTDPATSLAAQPAGPAAATPAKGAAPEAATPTSQTTPAGVAAPQGAGATTKTTPPDSSSDKCVAQPSGTTAPTDLQTSLKDCVAPLEQLGLIAFPKSWDEWSANWGHGWDWLLQLVGILLSTALLSLGAPFWYAQLASLVRLRSVVSGKDDTERTERQTTQPPAPPVGSLPSAYRGGEAGDLAATG